MKRNHWMMALALSVLFTLFIGIQGAQAQSEEEALVERGRYIAEVGGCISCHTPFYPEYGNPATMTLEQLQTISLEEERASNMSMLLSGGRVFPIGAAGVVVSNNITPDIETGVGSWTDEELETAIRTGKSVSGRQMYPLMPYYSYNQMADSDMEALIAYLRSVPPVNNLIPAEAQLPSVGLPELPMPGAIALPPATDRLATGEYLVRAIVSCTDCHTALDPNTGLPMMDKFLAGGQPFEGPWGIIYSANLTGHETGLKNWSDAEIKRALLSGVNKDGRRLIFMPWQVFSNLTANDLDAVVLYLRNGLAPVENNVPAPALNEGFEQYVTTPEQNNASSGFSGPLSFILLGVVVVIVFGAIYVLAKRRQTQP